MVNAIKINKSIDQDRWIEFFDMFSNGNRGRLIALDLLDQATGDQQLINSAPLLAIVYDPVGKGNDLVIETGRDRVSYAHTIDAPIEVWTGQDENGLVTAMKVADANGNTTILTLK